MQKITEEFQAIHPPFKGIVVYREMDPDGNSFYVESFDFNRQWKPINFHPLTASESSALEKALAGAKSKTNFLHVQTMLPKTVLHVNPTRNGGALWYSQAPKLPLFFKEELNIPSRGAALPPLMWKATPEGL